MNEEQLEGSEPQDKEALKRRLAALTPKQRINLANALITFAYSEDREDFEVFADNEQERIMNLTPEELDAELRKEGFTDAHFEKLNKDIEDARRRINAKLSNEGNSASIQRAQFPAKEKSETSGGESLSSEGTQEQNDLTK